MTAKEYDLIIIGAGLVGLSTAYQFLLKDRDKKILVLEKEKEVAAHQSGHNSGVIHSGIYYKPGSLKAKNCISGYRSIIEFAEKYDIPYEICGKIIVAVSEKELPALKNIHQRGIENGLENLRQLSAGELKEYEPYVAGIAGLHVPQTGIIDYPAVARKLAALITKELGGEIAFRKEVMKIIPEGNGYIVETRENTYRAARIVSCAGLQSDRVANLTEPGNDLRIIPFRGEYYKLKPEKEYLINNLVYPVPNPNFPFLGVHFTRMIHGGIEAGPNAVLAFKREGYRFKDFNLKDSGDTFSWPGFWKVAAKYGATGLGEIYRSLSKAAFTKALQQLLPQIESRDLMEGGAGVRAQACDRDGNLIDDFNILEKKNIIHIRNAPSPAATSCLSIGKWITDRIAERSAG
jgi:L-2-hydroxyglutarate oxidase